MEAQKPTETDQGFKERLSKVQGTRLRSFRTQRGLTLLMLAEKIAPLLDKQRSARTLCTRLSRYESGVRGYRGYSGDMERALCTVLDCTADELTKSPPDYKLREAGFELHRLVNDAKQQLTNDSEQDSLGCLTLSVEERAAVLKLVTERISELVKVELKLRKELN